MLHLDTRMHDARLGPVDAYASQCDSMCMRVFRMDVPGVAAAYPPVTAPKVVVDAKRVTPVATFDARAHPAYALEVARLRSVELDQAIRQALHEARTAQAREDEVDVAAEDRAGHLALEARLRARLEKPFTKQR